MCIRDSPNAVLEWIKGYTYTDAQAKKMSPEELEGKLRCGQYICVEKPVYAGTTNMM